MDTIFALSSGQPPAGIAIIRVSGPAAAAAIKTLAGCLPAPRQASLRHLRDDQANLLDQALVLWFPGPDTTTGEDLAEFHLHGGRAVIAAIEQALSTIDGLRKAQAGEFTRRAFTNGRIDLSEAEGLADLLVAETELQRQAALHMAGGAFSRRASDWRDRVLELSAGVEAVLDFDDEDDVSSLPEWFDQDVRRLAEELGSALAAPHAEILREGYRVVLAGPPNAGKSSLFNALVESEAAITAPTAGTTRDVLVRPVAMEGIPFSFIDTAGLREIGQDQIEEIGIGRARDQLDKADCVLWLGPEGEGPAGAWEIEPQIDRDGHCLKSAPGFRVSALTGEGLTPLKQALVRQARTAIARPGEAALNARQRGLLEEALAAVKGLRAQGSGAEGLAGQGDLLIMGEHLRVARHAFDRLIGRAATEDMLDTLFGRFCIGK